MTETWESNGVRGLGLKPAMAGGFKGSVIILGSARCLWDDLDKFWSGKLRHDETFMAVNLTGVCFPGEIIHLTTLHTECLDAYLLLTSLKQTLPVWVHTPDHWRFPVEMQGGTSVLFAAYVALALGYDSVVLAGCPLDNSGNFYHPHWHNQYHFDVAWAKDPWTYARDHIFQDRVKSLSGFTKNLLGGPVEPHGYELDHN